MSSPSSSGINKRHYSACSPSSTCGPTKGRTHAGPGASISCPLPYALAMPLACSAVICSTPPGAPCTEIAPGCVGISSMSVAFSGISGRRKICAEQLWLAPGKRPLVETVFPLRPASTCLPRPARPLPRLLRHWREGYPLRSQRLQLALAQSGALSHSVAVHPAAVPY